VLAGKKVVIMPSKQSEANKRFMKELAYRRSMQNRLIGQWLVGMHQHNQHQKALAEAKAQQQRFIRQQRAAAQQAQSIPRNDFAMRQPILNLLGHGVRTLFNNEPTNEVKNKPTSLLNNVWDRVENGVRGLVSVFQPKNENLQTTALPKPDKRPTTSIEAKTNHDVLSQQWVSTAPMTSNMQAPINSEAKGTVDNLPKSSEPELTDQQNNAIKWLGGLIQNPTETLQALSVGVTLHQDYDIHLTADDNGTWLDWSSDQVLAAYNATDKTNFALNHIITPEESTPTAVFTETVGPVELRLGDNNAPNTEWLPDDDRAVIHLPDDFVENSAEYGEEHPEWLITGEYFATANHRSFGTFERILQEIGTVHDGVQVSGQDSHSPRWIYDEYGIFDFSALGGPQNSQRHNYKNDTELHELRDMGKQLVFFYDFAQDFENPDELHKKLVETLLADAALPLNTLLSDDELALLGQPLNLPEDHDAWVDLIEQFPAIASLTEEQRTNYRYFIENNGNLPDGQEFQRADIEIIIGQASEQAKEYYERYKTIITMLNRNADMEGMLQLGHTVSLEGRDPEVRDVREEGTINAHNTITSLTDGNSINHMSRNERFNWGNPDWGGRFMGDGAEGDIEHSDDYHEAYNQGDISNLNPTEFYKLYQLQNDLLIRLIAYTDWANPAHNETTLRREGKLHSIVSGDDYVIENIKLNLPVAISSLPNSQLASLLLTDLPEDESTSSSDLKDKLETAILDHFEQNGYQEYEPAQVDNYNARFAEVLALVGASMISDRVGDTIDIISGVSSLMRGDGLGAAIDFGSVIVPSGLKYVGDFISGGRRLVSNVADRTLRVSDYISNTMRKVNDSFDTMYERKIHDYLIHMRPAFPPSGEPFNITEVWNIRTATAVDIEDFRNSVFFNSAISIHEQNRAFQTYMLNKEFQTSGLPQTIEGFEQFIISRQWQGTYENILFADPVLEHGLPTEIGAFFDADNNLVSVLLGDKP